MSLASRNLATFHPYSKEKKIPVNYKGKSNVTDHLLHYSLKSNAKCTQPSITSDVHFFRVENEMFLSVMWF